MPVDLNVDLGETEGEPRELYALATVVNVACGGHAGDVGTMARAVSFALARGVKLAAHPSYPDRHGFGRTTIAMTAPELEVTVAEQCKALLAIASKLGHRPLLMKPHGALYHDASRDRRLARAVVAGAVSALGEITIVGPPCGEIAAEASARGLAYAREGFADRRYTAEGTLAPRSEAGSLILEPIAAARQAVELARSGRVDTICVHGDTPGAVDIARAVRDALGAAHVLAAPG